MNNKTIFVIAVVGVIMMTATTTATNSVFADKNAFESGYSHGCDDAGISNSEDMYINGVNDDGESTGPNHHTDKFMNGYNAGYIACSAGSSSIQTVDDDHSNQQEQNQAAYTNQKGSCGLILIGDCSIGQSSRNNFANDADN